MSILTTPTQEDRKNETVKGILLAPHYLAVNMASAWSSAFDNLWNNSEYTPTELLEGIGTNGKELFEVNTAFVGFMVSNLTGKNDELLNQILAKVSTIPAHTINEDGTVTITVEEEPPA